MDWVKYAEKMSERLYVQLNDGGIQETACHSIAFYLSKGSCLTYFSYKRTPYTITEINNWVKLLNKAGFPMKKVKQETLREGTKYDINKSLTFDFHIVLLRKDYVSQCHFKTGLTLMRMISYHIMCGLENVIPESIKLHKAGEDAYKAICLAFNNCTVKPYENQDVFYICNHNLMGTTQKVKVMSTEEMLTKIKKIDNIYSLHY